MAPFQVAQIYNTLAAGGYYTPLLAIRDVTTRKGKPLNRYPLKLHHVVDEAPVYLDPLDDGAGRAARHRRAMYNVSEHPNLAGKTGTTNNLRDSWFAGFAPIGWRGLGRPRRRQVRASDRRHRRAAVVDAHHGRHRRARAREYAAGRRGRGSAAHGFDPAGNRGGGRIRTNVRQGRVAATRWRFRLSGAMCRRGSPPAIAISWARTRAISSSSEQQQQDRKGQLDPTSFR